MTTERDVEKFKQWASRMGCPLQNLPCLSRTFTTAQGHRLLQVTRRIAPAAEVTAARQNILLHQLHQYQQNSSLAGSVVGHQHGPEIKRLIHVRELRTERARLQAQIATKRKLLDALHAKVAEKSRTHVRSTSEVRLAQANARLLVAKLRSLEENHRKERSIAETIGKLMPVQYDPAVHSDAQAADTIRQTIASIHEHYAEQAPDAEPTPLTSSSAIWSRLAAQLQNVPNNMLWSQIIASQTRNVDAMKRLCAEAARSKNLAAADRQPSARSQLQLFLMRARTKHIGIELQLAAVAQQLERTYAASLEPYDAFVRRVHELVRQACPSRNEMDVDGAVNEYIAEYTASLYNRGQLDYVQAELQARQREYDSKCARLADHVDMIAELQSVYTDAERQVNVTREASTALYAIKQKLQFLEGNMRALMVDARGGSQAAVGRRQLNATINAMLLGGYSGAAPGTAADMSLGSFNLSQNSDLCSTRLEDHLQTSMVDTRMVPASPIKPKLGYAQHVVELNTYLEMTLANVAKIAGSVTTLQQLVHDSVPKHALLQTELYQFSAFVAHAQQTAEWQAHLQTLSNANGCNNRLYQSQASHLKEMRSAEHNRLVELRDKCDVLIDVVQQKQQLADRLCAFLVENTLRHFIPASKLFNGRSYHEYEDEYMVNFNIVCAATESVDSVVINKYRKA